MITIHLMGGLGNQLFQIFTTISTSFDNKIVFKFEKEKMDKQSYNFERDTYWDNLLLGLKKFLTNDKLNLPIYKEPNFHFNNIIIDNKQDIKLYGYFQSYKYFDNNFEKIKRLIKLDNVIEDVKNKHFNNYIYHNCISIHFRVGDYKYLHNFHPILTENYYVNSLLFICNKDNNVRNVLYFCEKEDNDFIESMVFNIKDKIQDINFIKIEQSIPDWEQMIIMSLCKHNIIANSSFSWWAAYLNKNKDKIITYPDKWFGEKLENHDTKDFLPKKWFKIMT
jgi:hypothetical protein